MHAREGLGVVRAAVPRIQGAGRLELLRRRPQLAQVEAKARQSEADAKAVLDFVENKVFAAARPKDQVGGLGYDVQLADAIKSALPYVETSFPQQPLIEARLRMTLGQSFLYLGKATIAIDQFQRARELYTRHRGPDHPDTLKSMNNLANSYYDLARHADALKLHEETLALDKAKLGPDHPDTLLSMHNLASSYYALGRHADALKLNEETLALKKAKLGPDHPDTLWSMYNIACSHALMIPKSQDGAKEAELGMDWLKKAVAAGLKDAAQIAKDKDLDALRGREDFKKLLAEVQGRQEKAKK